MAPQLRSAGIGDHERFVAFAFAGANLVVETEPAGRIVYAAGSFRTEFLHPPEHFLGTDLRALVAPADREALDAALVLLGERGRLLPMTVRLANPRATRLALAGLVMPRAGGPPRFCLTFSVLPAPEGTALASLRGLTRAAEARLRGAEPGRLGVIEISGASSPEAVGAALQALVPGALASEVAPGRFGLLDDASRPADLLNVADLLEKALEGQGMNVHVAAGTVPLAMDGLTTTQAARALRQALNLFAINGTGALMEAGFSPGGLAGYLRKAGRHASALRHAIRAGQFDLAYQPIVALADGAVHHYEALIRPRPIPDCHVENPQDFILMVEALGLAGEVDIAVAEKACAAAHQAEVAVAFNLSSLSVQDPAFRVRLVELLERSPAVRDGRISVEMTETAAIENIAEAAQTVAALRGLGVAFCLDDFGAGAADVRALRGLGADIVKLDGSYVPGVAEPGRERAFVQGMVEIARAAGAAIVVEQIETERDAAALHAMGVEYGQGWLFGRPAALPERAVARSSRRRGSRESWG